MSTWSLIRDMGLDGPAASCTKTACDHFERESPAFSGHCSRASCPNYMDSCPVHENYGLRDGR